MAELVYILCGITSGLVAVALFLQYCRLRTKFLLWSSLCFVGIALNNALLVMDMVVFPNIDFSLPRIHLALLGVSAMIFGFIWDAV